ncbi:hypothetical protein MRB53_038482 [Persea americana]|nr:hypothetical protein MRB53_038482 [Persea americana]
MFTSQAAVDDAEGSAYSETYKTDSGLAREMVTNDGRQFEQLNSRWVQPLVLDCGKMNDRVASHEWRLSTRNMRLVDRTLSQDKEE